MMNFKAGKYWYYDARLTRWVEEHKWPCKSQERHPWGTQPLSFNHVCCRGVAARKRVGREGPGHTHNSTILYLKDTHSPRNFAHHATHLHHNHTSGANLPPHNQQPFTYSSSQTVPTWVLHLINWLNRTGRPLPGRWRGRGKGQRSTRVWGCTHPRHQQGLRAKHCSRKPGPTWGIKASIN